MAGQWTGRLLLVAAVLGTIGCDRVTKHVASTTLVNSPSRSYLADTVRVGYVENQGGFLSLGSAFSHGVRTVIFIVATGVMLFVLTAVAVRRRLNGWPALGLALFVAGGVSNWIDRITQGTVVDFLNVGIGPMRTGIFNIADVAIMIGVVVFTGSELADGRRISGSSSNDDGTA